MKILTKFIWLGSLSLALVVPLSAQAIESYVVQFYAPGAPVPIQTESWSATSVTCGVPKLTGASSVNPTKFVWDDPTDPTKDCLFSPPTGGVLVSLPLGSYEGALHAVNAAGAGAPSNRAAFSKAAVPAAPTGFRIVR